MADGTGDEPPSGRASLPSAVLDRAADAVAAGKLVVYPTETVYGLGADALDAAAIERVFAVKGRARDEPISMGVASVGAALEHVRPTAREERFMRAFLPGPVTVLAARGPAVPDVLTGGRRKVGVRVPAHEGTRALLAATGPLTATSANVSGEPSARTVEDLDERIREAAAVVVDGGRTPGGGSTVVDVEREEVLRRGPLADEIEAWLADASTVG